MDSVTVAGLKIPIFSFYSRPQTRAEVLDKRFMHLDVLFAWAANGHWDALVDAVENRRRAGGPGTSVNYPEPEYKQEFDEFKHTWSDVTGEDPGDDYFTIRVAWETGFFVVPRAFLLELVQKLSAVPLNPNPAISGNEAAPAVAPAAAPASPATIPHGESPQLAELEAALAQLDIDAKRTPDAPEVHARRATLLARIESAGILLPAGAAARAESLERDHRPVLASYARAAASLADYYACKDRERYFPATDRPPIAGGPISLDWFRAGSSTPQGAEPFAWLSFFEHLLRTANLTDAYASELMTRSGGRWFKLQWRRDNGSDPSLVSALMV